jgi:hypothetical protein
MGINFLERIEQMPVTEFRLELERIRRVSDMLTTGHANLRDRYAHRATILDVAIMVLSTWLTAVVFIEPRISVKLTPFGMDPQLWVGFLGIFTFLLSIVQLRVDWKGRSDAHKRSFDLYSEVKRECGYLLASQHVLTAENCQRVLSRYDLATEVGIPLPEDEFLSQKQKHLKKIEISRHLDKQPSASLLLLRAKFWFRDNRRKEGP